MKALITGATSGIGQALADLLEKKGYTVIRCGSALCDLSKDHQPVIDLIQREVPDLIINSAGFGLYGPAITLSTDEQLDLLEVNVKAVYAITIEAAKALKNTNRPGTICNISSAAAFMSYPHHASYAASKACVNNFSQALDVELKPYGIRVLASCPGQVETNFRNRAAKGTAKKTTFTMTPEQAAKHIFKQIQKGKPVYIFDWRTRLGILISRCVPRSLLYRALRANIAKRQ